MADGINVESALTEKMGPFPTWVWLAGLTGAGLAWYLWEQHKNAEAAASSSSSQTGTSPTEPTTGSQSTVEGTQYIPDYVFQNYNELPQSSPTTTANQVAVPNVVGMTVTNAATTIRAAGLVFGTGGQNGANTVTGQHPTAGTQVAPGSTVTITDSPAKTTTTTATQAAQYKAPTGLSAKKTGSGTCLVSWSLAGQPSPAPTSYTVALYTMAGALASQQTVSVPDTTGGTSQCTVSGLHPGYEYQVHVWANGGKTAPPHASTTVKV